MWYEMASRASDGGVILPLISLRVPGPINKFATVPGGLRQLRFQRGQDEPSLPKNPHPSQKA
jgi:hypothetical protein